MSRSTIFTSTLMCLALTSVQVFAEPASDQSKKSGFIPGLNMEIKSVGMPAGGREGVTTSVGQALEDPLAGDAPDFSMEGDNLGNHIAGRTLNLNGNDMMSAGGNVLMGGGRVLDIAVLPVLETEAASKFYVDSLVGGGAVPYDAGTGLVLTSETFHLADIYSGSPAVGAVRYNGNIRAPGRLYGGISNPSSTIRLNYDGAMYATEFFSNQYFYFSDETLKENILTISGADGMEMIRDIRPVRYDLKETGRRSLGVIAQEIEETLPYLVDTNETGLKSVDYIQLISPMIAAIQDLDARVEALEAQEDSPLP